MFKWSKGNLKFKIFLEVKNNLGGVGRIPNNVGKQSNLSELCNKIVQNLSDPTHKYHYQYPYFSLFLHRQAQ